MAKTVQLSLDERTSELLERADLEPDEVFRLGLAELERRLELKTRQAWLDSLPELELSDEERTDLTQALDEADKSSLHPVSVDEIIAAAKGD